MIEAAFVDLQRQLLYLLNFGSFDALEQRIFVVANDKSIIIKEAHFKIYS